MSFYRSITIDHTKVNGGSDLTNFTVLFSGTYTYLKTTGNGGKVESLTGYDILFFSDVGLTTELKFERVTWNAATGAVEIYIKVPTVASATDTVIYLSYGDAAVVTDHSDAANTWDADYVAVYHFGDGSTVNFVDSKGVNSGTGTNTPTAGASLLGGAGGGAVQLTASSSQRINCGDNASLRFSGGFTIEAVVHPDSQPGAANFPSIVAKRSAGSSGYNLTRHDSAGFLANSLYFEFAGTAVPGTDPNNIASGDTKTVAASYNGTNQAKIYIDGSLIDTQTFPAYTEATPEGMCIGCIPYLIGIVPTFWDGRIDEVRISKIQRTTGWLITSNSSISAPSSFYAIGSESGGTVVVLTQTASDTVNNFLDSAGNSGYKFQAISRSDFMTFVDSLSIRGGDPDFHIVFGDALHLNDSLSPTFLQLQRQVSDSIGTLLDSIAKMVGIPIQAFDSNMDKWADACATALLGPYTISKSDTLTLTDLVAIALRNVPFLISSSDTMNHLQDALRMFVVLKATAGDNFVLSDALQLRFTNLLRLVDTANNLADLALLNMLRRPAFSDSMSITDAVSLRMSTNTRIQVADSANSYLDSVSKNLVGVYSDRALILRIRRYLGDTN